MNNTDYQVSNKRAKQNSVNRSRIGANIQNPFNEHPTTFVTRADEKLTTFLELELAASSGCELS